MLWPFENSMKPMTEVHNSLPSMRRMKSILFPKIFNNITLFKGDAEYFTFTFASGKQVVCTVVLLELKQGLIWILQCEPMSVQLKQFSS